MPRTTRSKSSNAELLSGLEVGPCNPPRANVQRSDAKYFSGKHTVIQKPPINFDMPEKGEVTIGHFTGKVASGKMQGRGAIEFMTNSFGWSSFKGSFRHGQLVGTGPLECDDGVMYEGELFPFLSSTSSSSVVKVAIHAEAEDG